MTVLIGLALMAIVADPADPWIRPNTTTDPQIWGFEHGIRVGLPNPFVPRGLLCVYHSELGLPAGHVINYIAIEPIVGGQRGYSEMERSSLDNTQGKRLWVADTLSSVPPDPQPAPKVRGRIVDVAGERALELFFYVEKFGNGAQPIVRARFYENRPDEVELAAYVARGSAVMSQCVLTATCGNYARLRNLRLKSRTVSAKELWPTFSGDGFAQPHDFDSAELDHLPNGDIYVEARPDEDGPAAAEYAAETPFGWKYTGLPAAQYWRRPARAPLPRGLACRVNGRSTYYGTHSPVPGGIAFENFELIESFRSGAPQVFGVRLLRR
jgi:hypothetical protein